MLKTGMVVSLAVLAGCAQSTDRTVGMPNPASVYCQEQGGQLRIVNTQDGQVGMCVLPNGEEIEEWELYRRDHPELKG
ncbi:DUF333 domain-containing protein [Bordetella sp. BOR01]|uniref:putative hemolysin n=1 Tax=Bordetella sp. BOR01 TaxID=2854779 RepID=UPI001C47CF02|nr:DUF333 domain-containing protein [Bordetella sp. BOR01]MBV7482955.1 DUF333 domain-containing protein [Bordetella sp. BOR01]